MYCSRAIRAADWSHLRDALLNDNWQFRNRLKPETGDTDIGDSFWSSNGEPDIRMGVIYIRRPV